MTVQPSAAPAAVDRHAPWRDRVACKAAAAHAPHHAPGVNAGGAGPSGGAPLSRKPDAGARRAAAAALGAEGWRALLARVAAAADAALPAADLDPASAPPDPGPAPHHAAGALVGRGPPPASTKHDPQHAAIVAAAAAAGVLTSPDERGLLIVEIGAGRGYLGAAAACVRRSAALALIERNTVRNKADRHLRHRRLLRVRADAADVDVAALRVPAPAVRAAKVPAPAVVEVEAEVAAADTCSCTPSLPAHTHVAIVGKHLCGAATDLALVAALRLAARADPPTLAGVAIAPCCHHACCWGDYVGRRAFLEAGFSAQEFELVAFASTWATAGHAARRPACRGDGGDAPAGGGNGPTGLPLAERADGGADAKRLLDGCRAAALRAAGLTATVRAYVRDAGVTGENRLLAAVWPV
jgi:hypothetical protein